MYCAATQIDITPRRPVSLAGYGSRTDQTSDVASQLEANAVLLSDGAISVLLLSADLLYVGKDLRDALVAHAASHGVPPHHVILAASHTHFAPATDRAKPLLGRVDDQYLRFVTSQMKTLTDTVLTMPRRRVTLTHSRTEHHLNVCRRRRWPFPTVSPGGRPVGPAVHIAPYDRGERDDQLDVLRVEDSQTGDLVSLVWRFGCHPVSYPLRSSVSAEYPGVVRNRVRSLIGQDVPVVYWQGFSGDARPRLSGRPGWTDWLRRIARGPTFKPVTHAQWSQWAEQVAGVAIDTLRSSERAVADGTLRVDFVDIPLSQLLSEPISAAEQLRLTRICFDGSLEVVLVSAEVCAPYASRLRMGSGHSRSMFVGCIGDVFGYLPSQVQVAEGGYEARDFLPLFGYGTSFRHDAEQRVVDALAALRRDNARA